jgi:hypothetical protein
VCSALEVWTDCDKVIQCIGTCELLLESVNALFAQACKCTHNNVVCGGNIFVVKLSLWTRVLLDCTGLGTPCAVAGVDCL